jgi:hypothetical protein
VNFFDLGFFHLFQDFAISFTFCFSKPNECTHLPQPLSLLPLFLLPWMVVATRGAAADGLHGVAVVGLLLHRGRPTRPRGCGGAPHSIMARPPGRGSAWPHVSVPARRRPHGAAASEQHFCPKVEEDPPCGSHTSVVEGENKGRGKVVDSHGLQKQNQNPESSKRVEYL